MSNFNRFLLVFFFIITFGVLIEFGYYLYRINLPKKTTAPAATRTVETVKDNNAIYLSGIFKKMDYGEVSYIRNLLDLQDAKAYSSVLVTTDIRGTVAGIQEGGGYLDPKTPYEVKIDIIIPGREAPLPVFYSKEEYAKMTVLSSSSDSAKVKSTATLSGIKKGDKISVKETYDLVNFHLVKGEISRLE